MGVLDNIGFAFVHSSPCIPSCKCSPYLQTNTEKPTASKIVDGSAKVADARTNGLSSQRSGSGVATNSSGNAPPPLKRGQHQIQHGQPTSHSSHHKVSEQVQMCGVFEIFVTVVVVSQFILE